MGQEQDEKGSNGSVSHQKKTVVKRIRVVKKIKKHNPKQDEIKDKQLTTIAHILEEHKDYLNQLSAFNPQVKSLIALDPEALQALSATELNEILDSRVNTSYFQESKKFMKKLQENAEVLTFLSSLMDHTTITNDRLRPILRTYAEVQKGMEALKDIHFNDRIAMHNYFNKISEIEQEKATIQDAEACHQHDKIENKYAEALRLITTVETTINHFFSNTDNQLITLQGIKEKLGHHQAYLDIYNDILERRDLDSLINLQKVRLISLNTMTDRLNLLIYSMETRFIDEAVKKACDFNKLPYFKNDPQNLGFQAIQALTKQSDSGTRSYLEQFKEMIAQLSGPSEQPLTLIQQLIKFYSLHIEPQQQALTKFNNIARDYEDDIKALIRNLKKYQTNMNNDNKVQPYIDNIRFDAFINNVQTKEETLDTYNKGAMVIISSNFTLKEETVSNTIHAHYTEILGDLDSIANFKDTPEYIKIKHFLNDRLSQNKISIKNIFSNVQLPEKFYPDKLETLMHGLITDVDKIKNESVAYKESLNALKTAYNQKTVNLCHQTAETMRLDILNTIDKNASISSDVITRIFSDTAPEDNDNVMLRGIHSDLPTILACYRTIIMSINTYKQAIHKEMFPLKKTSSYPKHIKSLNKIVVEALTDTVPKLTDPTWKERFLEWIKLFTDWIASLSGKRSAESQPATPQGFFTTNKKSRISEAIGKLKEDPSKGP